jgi:hypothetical protein
MLGEGSADHERSSIDDVIEVYKRDVDRTLLRENLKLTPTERLQKLQELQRFAEELQRAGREARHPGD